MLELDECSHFLSENPFADDRSTLSSSDGDNHDTFVTPMLNSPDHPLRTRPLSPALRCTNTPSISSVTEDETRTELTSLPILDGSSARITTGTSANGALRSSSNTIVHPVGPNDSFAGVALRYGVSIAALRRANQLWPSDPIHFRTELLIPCGDILRTRRRRIRGPSTDATLQSMVEPTPNLSPDLVTSSLVAARSIIFSVLPARLSLDSLSSKASASEDHELDDLPTARAHKVPNVEAPFIKDGHELSVFTAPRAQYRLSSGVGLSSQLPCSPANNKHVDHHHISLVGDLPSRSSSTASLQRLPRRQPFAVLPVRTLQLEPEPAMELPVRRSGV